MYRSLTAAAALVLALPLVAQDASRSDDPIVASINGEVVTRARLDEIWNRVPAHLQKQYEAVGGKAALLSNYYIPRRVLLQHAIGSGFAKGTGGQLDVKGEAELFDRYVREVIAPTVVDDATVQEFYRENAAQFRHPPQAKLRHIFVSTSTHSAEEAREKLTGVMNELQQYRESIGSEVNRAELLRERFAELATRHSEEETSAARGGLVGWIAYDKLDGGLVEPARNLAKGTMSGILTSGRGLHIVFIDDRREAGVESLEAVANDIREFLMPRYMNKIIEVVKARTEALMTSAEVKVFAENLN